MKIKGKMKNKVIWPFHIRGAQAVEVQKLKIKRKVLAVKAIWPIEWQMIWTKFTLAPLDVTKERRNNIEDRDIYGGGNWSFNYRRKGRGFLVF